MTCLPPHGRVDCDLCYPSSVEFGRTRTEDEGWRITANPLAWGNDRAEIVILGFSKGSNALDALATKSHNDIPYARHRLNVAKILAHLGLIPRGTREELRGALARVIADQNGRFAWASLIRCTVERRDGCDWKTSGGGMLDRFMATEFGERIAGNCVRRHLGNLPPETKLVVLFGLGKDLGYVRSARNLMQRIRPNARWRTLNEVAYTDGQVVFAHTEHFAAQGSLIPKWLGAPDNSGRAPDRARLGRLAQQAVGEALASA